MDRVVIFAKDASGVPATLLRAALAALKSREGMELAAVCVPEPEGDGAALRRHLLHRTGLFAHALFDPAQRRRHAPPAPVPLGRWARRRPFALLVPPEGNVNHPGFIARLREEIRPTIALSFYFPRKFGPDLLAVFRDAVNYHNGLLPRYRGMMATAWSVYHGERETGFTFHRMTAELDAGPVLLRGAVPIRPGDRVADLEWEKANQAAGEIPAVLRKVAAGAPGEPQRGEASCFSRKDFAAATRIADPSGLSSLELARRLRAFGPLRMKLGGDWHAVTKIREGRDRSGRDGRICFRSADGVRMEAVRFRYLPYAAYRALGWALGPG